MGIDFKKFLPLRMRTNRWGEFIEVIQTILEDIKTDKIRPIFDQFDIEKASDAELLSYANFYGYKLMSLTGLTSTSNYLKKQVSTIIAKLIYKTTATVYPYIGVPYGLTSEGLNTIYDFASSQIITLQTAVEQAQYISEAITTLDWGSPNIVYYIDTCFLDYAESEYDAPFYTLDDDSFSDIDNKTPVYIEPNPNPNEDQTLDSISFSTLDMEFSLSMISRAFAFSYKFNFVENENEFLSIYSLKSLANDIRQVKRATEFVYYEPVLEIIANIDKSLTTKTWKNHSGIDTATQQSILIADNLTGIYKIRLGNGSYDTVYSGITDVQSYTQEFIYSGLVLCDQSSTSFCGRPLISENQHFSGVTEVAILNANSGCMLYSKFPEIHWGQDLLSNIKFEIQLV